MKSNKDSLAEVRDALQYSRSYLILKPETSRRNTVIDKIDTALARLDAPAPTASMPSEVRFLLERLDEWSNNHLTDEAARDWLGHVAPAIARVRGSEESHG